MNKIDFFEGYYLYNLIIDYLKTKHNYSEEAAVNLATTKVFGDFLESIGLEKADLINIDPWEAMEALHEFDRNPIKAVYLQELKDYLEEHDNDYIWNI